MSTQREADRQKVLEKVYQSIKQGMPNYSVEEYAELAREYGKKYGITGLVKDWIAEGRKIDHSSPQELNRWEESLP